jgi:lipid A 4'-phosphatase
MMIGTSARHIVVLLGTILASFALFGAWPDLDLQVTAQFHNPSLGFSTADSGWPNQMRLAVWRVSELVLIASIGALVYGLVRRRDILGLPRRVWVFILALYTLGPGILVDIVLKPAWGRARPANVTEFGGTLNFTPPTQIADECARNCSFVSGEVSGAVALAVALFLVLGHFRDRMTATVFRILALLILAVPVLIALQRIAAGRHFLSDAIFAALFTVLVAAILDLTMRPGGWISRLARRP